MFYVIFHALIKKCNYCRHRASTFYRLRHERNTIGISRNLVPWSEGNSVLNRLSSTFSELLNGFKTESCSWSDKLLLCASHHTHPQVNCFSGRSGNDRTVIKHAVRRINRSKHKVPLKYLYTIIYNCNYHKDRSPHEQSLKNGYHTQRS